MYVVPAVTLTGVDSVALCQPVAVSFVNVTVASRVPVELHREPVCVPLFPAPLKKRMAETWPSRAAWKAMPSSTGLDSLAAAVLGSTSLKSDCASGESGALVWKVQVWVASDAPSTEVTPDRTTRMSESAGSMSDGVNVSDFASADSATLPVIGVVPDEATWLAVIE